MDIVKIMVHTQIIITSHCISVHSSFMASRLMHGFVVTPNAHVFVVANHNQHMVRDNPFTNTTNTCNIFITMMWVEHLKKKVLIQLPTLFIIMQTCKKITL
jgi:hypothetical protein